MPSQHTDKGVSPLIASVFVLAITISGIVIVLNIGTPVIEKGRENTVFTQSRQNMEIVETVMNSVVYGGEGASRKVNLKAPGGTYSFNSTSEEARFTYSMETDLLPVGLCDSSGDMEIRTFGVDRVLDMRFDAVSGNLTEDCSAHGNGGRLEPNLTHGPSLTSGKLGRALEFDGSDDYVNISHSSSLGLSDGLTFSTWVKPSDTAGRQDIISKPGSYRLSLENGGEVCLSLQGIGSVCTVDGLTEKNWQHVSATWDGETAHIYLGGALNATGGLQGDMSGSSEDLTIGADASSGSYYLNGTVDELKVYDRALSADEIKELKEGSSTGRARELMISVDIGNVNITSDLRFGRGTHTLLFRNGGRGNGLTKISVTRL